MCQMFSIGERSGQQAGKFITQTLLLQSHAVVIAAVCGFALSCWNTQGLSWNRCRLEGSICCSKTFIYLSAFIVPYKTCKVPIPYAPPYHQRFWLYNWMLISRWKVSLHFSPEDMAFVISNKNVKFGLVWPWVRMSDAVLSEGPKNKGIQQRSLALSLMHPLGDFSSFSESFDDVMHCRWWDLQSLCNMTSRNVVFKVFHNLFTHSFTDWRASAHLYFWETLPL